MQNLITALDVFIPEFSLLFKIRYHVLQVVAEQGPIGRRGLAMVLQASERIIRKEVEVLSRQGLVEISHMGIGITCEGEKILSSLYLPLQVLEGASLLEQELEKRLGIKQVVIVKGNADQDEEVKKRLGMACASMLGGLLRDNLSIAITGGTTIAKMVEFMPRQHGNYKNLMVMPARGSVGGRAEFQANTVAVELAKKIGAQYELFTLPDNLSSSSIELIKQEPTIQKVLHKLTETDMIIFGIGSAMKMARRRNEPSEVIEKLESKKAVAEAFRHYFDTEGNIVYASQAIGVSPAIAKQIPLRLAIAGGESKASALLATRELIEGGYLIIDESVAQEIIKKLTI
ncbi:Cro/Cl family transcriptional regulator [Sporanaerobium hydrogeniformans]|uniref:Cro/Cl family transcriptional regulator n=1 Tax=Sporanaerobium hydrogeniformans TaxID=3072179 RepID=A0AC61DFQ2_9FIRM|nr:sugar-binding domain-containing protein [Sporanaerobium hydrogeniformans]PHV72105.1 Cro/Cl family transcriptional regulator [Sporanaerobium hydrogeniformans]